MFIVSVRKEAFRERKVTNSKARHGPRPTGLCIGDCVLSLRDVFGPIGEIWESGGDAFFRHSFLGRELSRDEGAERMPAAGCSGGEHVVFVGDVADGAIWGCGGGDWDVGAGRVAHNDAAGV
jgi:hypothetical protein